MSPEEVKPPVAEEKPPVVATVAQADEDDPDFPVLEEKAEDAAPVAEPEATPGPEPESEPVAEEPPPVVETEAPPVVAAPAPAAPPAPIVTHDDQKKATREFYGKVADLAMANVKEILGADYDEFDPVHVAAFQDQSRQILANVDAEKKAKQSQDTAVDSVARALSDNATKDFTPAMLAEAVQDLPHRAYAKIHEAYMRGDPAPMIEAIKSVSAKRQASAKVAAVQAKKAKEPPVAMTGGSPVAIPSAGSDEEAFDGFNL